MTSSEIIRLQEQPAEERTESNLRELCQFCFYDDAIADVYSQPTFEGRLRRAYQLLGGSADAEFAGFELTVPRE